MFTLQPLLSCKAGKACARRLQLPVVLALGIASSGFWLPVQLGFSPEQTLCLCVEFIQLLSTYVLPW